MELTTYSHAKQFLQAAGEQIIKYEVHNGLMLGTLEQLNIDPTPAWLKGEVYLSTVTDQDKLITAAMITPPFGLVLAQGVADDTAAIDLITEDLYARQRAVPDVNGPKFHSMHFAQTWSELTGSSFEPMLAERLYQLQQVTFPNGVLGEARMATPADIELVADWTDTFLMEALNEKNPREITLSVAGNFIKEQRVMLWQLDNQLVCMALNVRDTPNGAMIGYVFTPPQFRRHGYAFCPGGPTQPALPGQRQRVLYAVHRPGQSDF